MRTITVGTRKSELAVTQANYVVAQLQAIAEAEGLPVRFEMKKIVTKGDRILDVTLSKVGGKGLFVKEIEQALLTGEIDFAVHSMKDMPADLQDGLITAAITKREDPRDCLVSREQAMTLRDLPKGARVGTSSLRRVCQLKKFRPDLQMEFVRGNIGTRIGKLDSGEFDAIILAAAGLKRVGWEERISEFIPEEICLPAVGQGALGIECRADDTFLLELLQRINDEKTSLAVRSERAFLAELQGGCQVPIAAYGVVEDSQGDRSGAAVIRLKGLVGSPDGQLILQDEKVGADPVQLGVELAQDLKRRGADRILDQVRLEANE